MAKKAWLSLFLILSFLLPGCSSTQATVYAPLKVEWTEWNGDYTLLVAAEKGLFEKYGVQVEPVYYGTYSNATPALASHELDGALFGISDVLTASRVTDLKVVGAYDSGGTVAVISNKDINNVSDLRGKRVGVVLGAYGELFVRQMLKSAGMTIKDVELVNLDPADVISSLDNDTIAAGYVWAPIHEEAVNSGHKILYSQSAELIALDVIVFRKDVVEQRPEDIRAFLNAWYEAVEFRKNNPEEAQQIIARATNKPVSQIPLEPDAHLYSRDENLRLFDQDLSKTGSIYSITQLSLDFKISRGDITIPPDLNVILDPTYLQPLSANAAQ